MTQYLQEKDVQEKNQKVITKKIAILFSGEGTNMQNLIQKLHCQTFENPKGSAQKTKFKIEVALALTNNPKAKGIEKCRAFGIEPIILDHNNFPSREEFDAIVINYIKNAGTDLTILAGFMRILSPIFTQNIEAINLHPSILPLFKGSDAITKSFKSDMKVAGVSVHKVSAELDGGEILEQECFSKDGMDFDLFCAKIKEIEHAILPQSVIKYFYSTIAP